MVFTLGGRGEVVRVGSDGIGLGARAADQPCMPFLKDNAELPEFYTSRLYLLLVEIYGDHPHHNNGTHMYGIVM